jgi:hypothetical protein
VKVWDIRAFMMMQRGIYVELKGFDENCFMYSDDIDLSYRSPLQVELIFISPIQSDSFWRKHRERWYLHATISRCNAFFLNILKFLVFLMSTGIFVLQFKRQGKSRER